MNSAMTDIEGIRVKLASPEDIASWSHGEVTKPETINYRSQRPEKDGLYCEKIFGPTKDWQCYCGKYKGIRYKGITCDKCGVLLSRSNIRRQRMGHIKLAVPVTHSWFLRGTPSSIGLALGMSVKDLEKVIYFASFIVVSVDQEYKDKLLKNLETDYQEKRKELSQNQTEDQALIDQLAELDTDYNQQVEEVKAIEVRQLLSENKYYELSSRYPDLFEAKIGAEAIHQLLTEINLDQLISELKLEAEQSANQKLRKLRKRINMLESIKKAEISPSDMILTVLPVIPPELRPMVQLDGGRFATSDLNDLYRRVINRNNRLKKLFDLGAPEVICRNEKRMLQEAVDALIDNNSRRDKPAMSTGGKKVLKSLTALLKGKQGRFRQNLLGKRVDYSARSVIVVGPDLDIDQCGIPKKMAIELFRPFVIGKLIEQGIAHNIKTANRVIEQGGDEVWDALEEVIANRYVLLNRAPTLHRLSVQAFRPVLTEGKAISLTPLVCAAFNADFDGDQMAVHLPLSQAAQAEAREIMLSSYNLIKPSSGQPIVRPVLDMILGINYMTSVIDNKVTKYYPDFDNMMIAYQSGKLRLREVARVRLDSGETIETTIGRYLFNQLLPEGFEYINSQLGKSELNKIMLEIFNRLDSLEAAKFADSLKAIGFKYATTSGISIGMDDMNVPSRKAELLRESEEKVRQLVSLYEQGLITDKERYTQTVSIWKKTTEAIEKLVTTDSNQIDSAFVRIVKSGARGNLSNINQTSGMLGLVANPSGRTIELPVRSSYKEGLDSLEYFIALHGARKGLTDTALRTAESGYLTRKLVDVSQDIVVTEHDCGDHQGYQLELDYQDANKIDFYRDWLVGRAVLEDTEVGSKLKLKRNHILIEADADAILSIKLPSFKIRSVMSCKAYKGICQLCYGIDLSSKQLVEIGESVGVIAAQSIGEPGTQLTMRTFHSGGVIGEDITQGLPRVEELFEARIPKGKAVLSEYVGMVRLKEQRGHLVVRVEPDQLKNQEVNLEDISLLVEDKQYVEQDEVVAISKSDQSKILATHPATVKISKTKLILEPDQPGAQEYTIPESATLLVKDGQKLDAGDKITEGSINLQDLLRLRDQIAVERYIIDEIQKIYASQGELIVPKHIEIVIRQMFSKAKVIDRGDSELVDGEIVSDSRVRKINIELLAENKKPVQVRQLLMPITRVSTNSDSWLSAASFQETTRVLIGASLEGKRDQLDGLKENVIIGRLIPAGTGFYSSQEEE
ncbi:DNA-directed RNA polymerase subunit beta' [Candidatus Saccharibacteria bacterium]|nr:DNA-directed RNA polymerase subunit beta' [Candidatus Saccharibacteria bacterium]